MGILYFEVVTMLFCIYQAPNHVREVNYARKILPEAMNSFCCFEYSQEKYDFHLKLYHLAGHHTDF